MTAGMLALSLGDAALLAARLGPGTKIALGGGAGAVVAPRGAVLTGAEAAGATRHGALSYFLALGTTAAAIEPAVLGPVLDTVIACGGAGFAALCVAAPMLRRTVYQGHLFEGDRLICNLTRELSAAMDGRVGIVPHGITATGTAAIRARLGALKDQGYALAVIDALDDADCDAVAAAVAGQTVAAGPAWMVPEPAGLEPKPERGRVAVISGATDRQTLFQLAAAGAHTPLRYLNFGQADVVPAAIAWAAAQAGSSLIIAASAPPDKLAKGAPVGKICADIAAGLLALGFKRLVITGGDTGADVLAGLGVTELTAGASFGPLRWLNAAGMSFLLKPGSAGGREFFADLFGAGIEPYVRLNPAAE